METDETETDETGGRSVEQYSVTGMSCAACSARVEKAVSKVPGVSSCSVSLLTNSMGVEGTASAQEIIAAVQNAGYGAALKGAGEKSAKEEMQEAVENDETVKSLLEGKTIVKVIAIPGKLVNFVVR